MPLLVRSGRFDLLVVAAPALKRWPGMGVRAMATLCAEMELSVGLFGGEGLRVKGVLPLPSTGGVAIIEDARGRIHRIEGRAVVRVTEPLELPQPFSGWLSPGLLPLDTALQLRRRGQTIWTPSVAILGTGNRALMLGCELLESGVPEVVCIESPSAQISGWEVHRRRFETLGGRFLFGTPMSLKKTARMLWDLRVQDEHGIRVLEVAWVVSAGPFRRSVGVREFPPGSLLFELEQSSADEISADPEGWGLEEHRGRLLGGRISKALIGDWSERKEQKERLDEELRRARHRLKRVEQRGEASFELKFQGKWVAADSMRQLRAFAGVPQKARHERLVASIECLEAVECSLCQVACPEAAIDIVREKGRFLDEDRCTACGKCLEVCPSRTPVLVHEPEGNSRARLTLTHRGRLGFRENELAVLLNREGGVLGSGKVISSRVVSESQGGVGAVLEHQVLVEVPSHLAWEARGLARAGATLSHEEEWVMQSERSADTKVEVMLKGERRLLTDGQPLALSLFETGLARADDRLLCSDGSCGLCEVQVDGIKQLACRVAVHRGMSVQLDPSSVHEAAGDDSAVFCPCMGVDSVQVLDRIEQGGLRSPEAIRRACGVGEGRCRGRICQDGFRRILSEQGIDAEQWIDWRFPWSEWTISV